MIETAKLQKTEDDPLISVVVPIYNQQPYLYDCLASIQEQQYRNTEVLLIDDGSTDNSAEICQKICDEDPRFHLIRQENTGLGPSRNTGLSKASGKYICFVDADDCLHPSYLKILYENLLSSGADLSICGFRTFEENIPDSYITESFCPENEIQVLDQTGLLSALLKDDPVTTMVAWNKLAGVEWLKGFQFENKWHEDQFMINEYIRRCRKAVVTKAPLYFYRMHRDSIMGGDRRKNLRHLDDLEAREQRIRYFYQPEYKEIWKDLFLEDLNIRIFWYVQLYSKENAGLLKEKIYPSYVWGFGQYLRVGGLFRKDADGFRLILFLISPKLYATLRKLHKGKAGMKKY